ncbi:MAG: GAF domain-containing protein, partial [Deltaproteobacteria bacterium]|nr:GAF domain-containing protein [Deltaproteobacteria bacterium]
AVAESDNLETMVNHMAQLLVAALEIKGCNMFILNLEAEELEVLATFGLSTAFLGKGPIMADRSIGCTLKGDPVIIPDTTDTDLLQYPKAVEQEGIRAIVSIPIVFNREAVGVLRLYHHKVWNISERDVESLMILGENIGLAAMFTLLVNSLQFVNKAIQDLPMELTRLLRER